MRFLLTVLLSFIALNADIANQVNKNKSKQNTTKESNQISKQENKSIIKNKIKGNEKSASRTTTNTLNKILSTTHTVSNSNNGSWDIVLNPIPHILNELRELEWKREAFYLKNSDIGTSYFLDDSEEIIDMNAKSFYESKAQMRGSLSTEQIKKLQKYINILYYTAKIVEKTTKQLQAYPNLKIEKFDNDIKKAIVKAYKSTKYNPIYIFNCSFAGNLNSYNCNNGKYTLVITNALPLLYLNGAVFYSSNSVGFINPTLKISFASNINDAFSKVAQVQKSKVIANMIRDYTNKLIQKGETKMATKIMNKFIEKSLTTGINTTATATATAINSGSPIAVLKIFSR